MATTQALLRQNNVRITMDRYVQAVTSAKRNPACEMASVAGRCHAVDGRGGNCLNVKRRAHNSAVECHLHTVEVVGSNPAVPTI